MTRINHRWRCEFKGGKPVLEDPERFRKDCLELEGKVGYLSLLPWRKFKSNNQNKYYRGVVVKRFADYWGGTNEEAHQALSREHLSVQPGNPEMPSYIKSTANMEWSAVEFEDYMEFLRRWAAEEFGIYIELPNEVDMDSLPDVYH